MGQVNFLIIMTDEMQSACLGCNGNPDVKTPNIDSLAKDGVSFQQAYCANSVCMPSRSTLLTGLTPRQHGCVCNGSDLSEKLPTVVGALRANGYRTFSGGKIHVQVMGGMSPNEEHIKSKESMQMWNSGKITHLKDYFGFEDTYFHNCHVRPTHGDYYNEMMREHPEVIEAYQPQNAYYINPEAPRSWRMDIPKGLHYNDRITDECIRFMSSCKDQPFYTVCSFPDPHLPYAATKPYSEMYDPNKIHINPTAMVTDDLTPCLANERKTHRKPISESGIREITAQTYGMITHVDDCVGRLIQYLKDSGKYDNTVIVFMSDHGEYLGAQNLFAKSYWAREELLRVPYIWKLPKKYEYKKQVPVSLLDFVPTILDIAGVSEDYFDIRGYRHGDKNILPGRSLKPYLTGEELEEKPVMVEYDEDFHPGTEWRTRSLIYKGFKLTLYGHHDEGILIDLKNDPNELVNLYKNPKYKEIVALLMKEMMFICMETSRFSQVERFCGF